MKCASLVLVLALLSGGLPAQDLPRRPDESQPPEQQTAEDVRRALAGPDEVPPALSPAETAALLARQRGLAEVASEAVGHPVQLLEDDHFIFLSDLSQGQRRQVMGSLQALYRHLDRIFLASRNQERMWDGKLVVVVLARRADYLKYALKLHEQPSAVFAGGYFHPEPDAVSGGLTASVVVPLPEEEDSLGRLQPVLVHETTHAFLYFWKRPGRTPLWLHEGTAVHMQAMADTDDPQVKALRQVARTLAGRGEGYPILFATEGLMPRGGADTEGYAQALAMTEMMLAADSKRYVRFVRLMKEGQPQKEALVQAYGWGYDALEKNWRRYARREY